MITNFQYPSSSEEELRRYAFSVTLTETGMRSEWVPLGYVTEQEVQSIVGGRDFGSAGVFLCSDTIRVDNITKPEYEPIVTQKVVFSLNMRTAACMGGRILKKCGQTRL